jgi:1,4-dihydroxy-2-naphthoyl-CoA hydrolase
MKASAVPNEALTAQIRESMPFAELLGIEMLAADRDEVTARLAWDESRCTAAGILHGGALMSLADAAGGLLAFLNLPEGATGTATIESKTNFFGAVRSGHVVARSRPLHRGRTTFVVETDLFDDKGRHVARVTQTQAVLGP